MSRLFSKPMERRRILKIVFLINFFSNKHTVNRSYLDEKNYRSGRIILGEKPRRFISRFRYEKQILAKQMDYQAIFIVSPASLFLWLNGRNKYAMIPRRCDRNIHTQLRPSHIPFIYSFCLFVSTFIALDLSSSSPLSLSFSYFPFFFCRPKNPRHASRASLSCLRWGPEERNLAGLSLAVNSIYINIYI